MAPDMRETGRMVWPMAKESYTMPMVPSSREISSKIKPMATGHSQMPMESPIKDLG